MYSIPTYYTLIHKLSHLIQNQHESKYHAVKVTTMPLQFSWWLTNHICSLEYSLQPWGIHLSAHAYISWSCHQSPLASNSKWIGFLWILALEAVMLHPIHHAWVLSIRDDCTHQIQLPGRTELWFFDVWVERRKVTTDPSRLGQLWSVALQHCREDHVPLGTLPLCYRL